MVDPAATLVSPKVMGKPEAAGAVHAKPRAVVESAVNTVVFAPIGTLAFSVVNP